jgi:hypothetical protein
MLRKLRERLTYANVMSTLAVFLVLGTGTAYATHLVVNSSDVVNESLVSGDLKNGLAVKSADITNESVTGADVNEGTLGRVPAATLGGLGRSAASSEVCDPGTSSYVRCVQVSLDLPASARVHLNARITAIRTNAPSPSWVGKCRWGGVVESGPITMDDTDFHNLHEISLVGITGVLPPGQGYTFAVECSDPNGGAVLYKDAWITAVAISPA